MNDLEKLVTRPTARPPRVVLYGTSGVGKSTFGASAPSPIFIDTEDGLDQLDVNRIRCRKLDTAMGVLRSLYKEEHDYKTVVIDSIDWLERLIFDQVVIDYNRDPSRKKDISSIEEIAYAKGYVFAIEHWSTLLNALTSLRNDKGLNIILLGHDMIKRYDDPMTDSYERHQLKLHQRSAALITEWSDCLLFANHKVYVNKEEVGFQKEIKRGMGGGRVIYTVEKPSFIAKNRYNLPEELPLSWESVSELLPFNGLEKVAS